MELVRETTKLQPVVDTSEAQEADIELPKVISDRYTNMTSKALNIDAEQIETVGELEGAREYVSGLLEDRFREEKMDTVEYLVSQGRMTPLLAMSFLNTPKYEDNAVLETMLGLNGTDKASVEDDTQGAVFATDQKEYEVNVSMLANTQFFESELAAARTQAPGFSWEGIKNIGMEYIVPFVGWYKEANRELQPTTYKNLNKIREANSALLYTNINHMAPHEFQKWLNERKQEHFANGGNASTWLDLLEKSYDTPGSGWGYFEMGADLLTPAFIAGKTAKGATLGVRAAKLAGTSITRAGFTGAAKAAAVGAAEEIPLLPTVIRGTGKVVKGVSNVLTNDIKYMKTSGNRRGAAKALSDAIKAGEEVYQDPKLSRAIMMDENLDTAVKTTAEDTATLNRTSEVKFANEYSNALKQAKELAEEGGNALKQATAEAIAQATNKRVEEYLATNKRIQGAFADTLDFEPIQLSNGNISARFLVGTGDGLANPFSSEAAALKALSKYKKGASGAHVIVKDKGAYWIQVDLSLKKNKGTLLTEYWDDSTGRHDFVGGLFGWLTKRASTPESLVRLDNITQQQQNFVMHHFSSAYKNIDRLRKGEKEDLKFLVDISRDGKYLTPEAMLAKGFTQDTVDCYQQLRLARDVAWQTQQGSLAQQLKELGFKRIKISDTTELTGRQIFEDAFNEDRWFIVEEFDENGQRLQKPFKMSRAEFKNKYKNNYYIVETLYGTEDIPARMSYRLVPKKVFSARDLDSSFASYVPGFSRIYSADATYIKQLQVSTLPDGTQTVGQIKTITADMDPSVARGYARELELIRQAVADFDAKITTRNTFSSKEALSRWIAQNSQDYLHFSSYEDFKKFAADNSISLDPASKIEAVKDGQRLKAYDQWKNTVDEETLKELDEMSKFDFMSHQYNSTNEGKIVNAQRSGRILTDIRGDKIPFIDAQEEAKHWVRQIENTTVLSDYTKLYSEAYANMFKDVIPSNLNPMQALRSGQTVAENLDNARLISAAKKAKAQHDFMRGVMNQTDVKVAAFFGHALTSLGDNFSWLKKIPGIGDAFVEGSNLQAKIARLQPLDSLRWFVTHYYLGMLNPRQIFTQSAAVANTIALSPKAGFKALPFAMVTPILLIKRDKKALEQAYRGLLRTGVDFQEAPKFLDELLDVLSKMDIYGRTSQGGAITEAASISSRLNDLSLATFQTGEAFNRHHAALTAVFEQLNQGKTLAELNKLNKKDFAKLLTRQNDLYMNMNKAGIAPIQMSQVGKTALQMKGFQMRFLEAFANKALTAAERRRLLITNLMLSGVGGTVGFNVYNWMVDTDEPKVEGMNNAAMIVNEGIINYLARQLFDNPINFAELFSPQVGTLLTDINDIFTGEIAVTSALKKAYQGFDVIFNYIQHYKFGAFTWDVGKDLLAQLATQRTLPSGINNTYLAYHIHTTGEKLRSNGQLVAKDLSNYHAAATLFGFRLLKEEDMMTLNAIKYGKKEKLDKAYKDLKPWFADFVRNSSNPNKRALFGNYMKTVFEDYGITSTVDKQEVWKRLYREAIKINTEESNRILIDILRDSNLEGTKSIMETMYPRGGNE